MKGHIREVITFMLGFMPWILFFFISGHSLSSLERALIICFVVSFVIGFQDLRKGFFLAWGTISFFILCIILINGYKVTWFATHMTILANGFLASIMWVTIILGNPFTLQYARAEIPKELWYDENVIQGCRLIATVWGILMSIATGTSFFAFSHPGLLPSWIYFDISLAIMISGTLFTSIYKHHKKSIIQQQSYLGPNK